jgi:hypothetical protein
MKNWGNWTRRDLEDAITTARKKGDTYLSISQQHTDWQNDQRVERWLMEMGLEFKTEMERTVIKL